MGAGSAVADAVYSFKHRQAIIQRVGIFILNANQSLKHQNILHIEDDTKGTRSNCAPPGATVEIPSRPTEKPVSDKMA